MWEFCECSDCGFVLLADSEAAGGPKRWDACPDCAGTGFELLQR